MLIECNPRPGGPIPEMWERLTGRDFARAYLALLNGDDRKFATPLVGACGEHLVYPAEDERGSVTGVDGLSELARRRGVDVVQQRLAVGEVADPHEGDYSAVLRVLTSAPSSAGVVALDRQLRTMVDVNIDVEAEPEADP